jgi:hypothetical protein
MLLRLTSDLEQLKHQESMAALSLKQPPIEAKVSGHATAESVQRTLLVVGLHFFSYHLSLLCSYGRSFHTSGLAVYQRSMENRFEFVGVLPWVTLIRSCRLVSLYRQNTEKRSLRSSPYLSHHSHL